MPLFACSKCGCVENTALGNYWRAASRGEPVLCSECDPAIGHWHGRFPKEPASDGWRPDPRKPHFLERVHSEKGSPSEPRLALGN